MINFNPISKLMIGSGVVLILAGLFWQFGGKLFPLGRLPGDIVVEKENFKFYFPIVTSLVLSVVFSTLFYLIRYFIHK
jgi:hypothetical protein